MTAFDILVPVIALVVAGVGTAILHVHTRKLDRGDKPRRS